MMSLFADWSANRGRPQIQLVLFLFRLAQGARAARMKPVRILLGLPLSALYRTFALFALSIDIPVSTTIGAGLSVHHGFGLVVHNRATVGRGVVLRHGTTLGAKAGTSEAPTLHDGVDVGAGVAIIGSVSIGEAARIGAGAVVVTDVPAGATAVGNPARVLGEKSRAV